MLGIRPLFSRLTPTVAASLAGALAGALSCAPRQAPAPAPAGLAAEGAGGCDERLPPVFDEFAGRGGSHLDRVASTLLATSLDTEVIHSVVRAHRDEIRACYQAGLARHPDLAGRLTLRWTVRYGEVEEVELMDVRLDDACVILCVVEEVATWSFPRMRAAEEVKINYPFLFGVGGREE